MKRILLYFALLISAASFAQTSIPKDGYFDVSGTNVYTFNASPAATYTKGATYKIRFLNANTTTATLNPNGIGAKPLVKHDGTALASGDVAAGSVWFVIYDLTTDAWKLIGGGGSGSVEWGDITGTISDQTDLQSALDAVPNIYNSDGTLTGSRTVDGDGHIVTFQNASEYNFFSDGGNATFRAGSVQILNDDLVNGGQLSLREGGGANYVSIKAPNSLSADYTYTLPSTYGTSGQLLQTDGSGGLTWATGGGTGTVTNVSSANGALSVSNPTTTPVLTVNSAPILTTARNINGVSFNGSANITVSGVTYTFSSSAPSDIYTRWIDTGSGNVRERPIRDYVNGGWTPVSNFCDWWDILGSVISKGIPFYIAGSGQSNAFNATYFPNDNPSYTGDITSTPYISYYNTTAGAWQIFRSTTLGEPFNASVGSTQVETFAKLFVRENKRSVRIVGTRIPGQTLAGTNGWEAGGTSWTGLTTTFTNAGTNNYDVFLWMHGEAGLGSPSSFANYQDSFTDFISRLRGLSGANTKMLVITQSEALSIQLPVVPVGSAEFTFRALASGNDVYSNWAKGADSKEAQFGAVDLYHYTTREMEKIGASMYLAYKELPRFNKKYVPAPQWDTYTGNLITTRKIAYQPVAIQAIQHQAAVGNGTGEYRYEFGNSASDLYTSKFVAKSVATNARVDFQFWANGSGVEATVSDIAVNISSAGTLFSKPVLVGGTANALAIANAANNSGDASLYFFNTGATVPTNTIGRTGIISRSQGSFGYGDLRFVLGGSASNANIGADTKVFFGQGAGGVADYRFGFQSATGVTLGPATVLGLIYGNQSAQTGASATPSLRLDAGAHTALSSGVEINDIYFNTGRTVQYNAGSQTLLRSVRIGQPTHGFVGSSTVTEDSNVYIGGAPAAGTNATLTRTSGIYVAAGAVGAGSALSYGAYFNAQTGGTANYALGLNGNAHIVGSAYIGSSLVAPTARLHLAAGTATAGTAPAKLVTGTALTTPEDGAIEYHSSHLYFTIGSTRYQLDQQSGSGISGLTANRIPFATSSTTIGDDAGLTYNATTDKITVGALNLSSFPSVDNTLSNVLVYDVSGDVKVRNIGTSDIFITGTDYLGSAISIGTSSSRKQGLRIGTVNTSTAGDGISSADSYETSAFPNNTVFVLRITCVIIKSDGSEGGTLVTDSSWRKNNSGTLTKISDTVINGSEDAAGTITLTSTSAGTAIQASVTRSGTSGTFHYSIFIQDTVNSY